MKSRNVPRNVCISQRRVTNHMCRILRIDLSISDRFVRANSVLRAQATFLWKCQTWKKHLMEVCEIESSFIHASPSPQYPNECFTATRNRGVSFRWRSNLLVTSSSVIIDSKAKRIISVSFLYSELIFIISLSQWCFSLLRNFEVMLLLRKKIKWHRRTSS